MHRKSLPLLWFTASALVAVMAGYFWLGVGAGTGVRWKNSTASELWVSIYLIVWVAILLVSAWLGYVVAKIEMRRP